MALGKRMYKWFLVMIIVGGALLLFGHRSLLSWSSRRGPDSILYEIPTNIPTPSSRMVAQPRVHAVQCRKLFDNNEAEKQLAFVKMRYPRLQPADESYVFPASECRRFIYGRGYTMSSMTEEEREFPIAFSIVMFKDVAQVERLLRAIYRPQNHYCIHVDKKASNAIRTAMNSIAACFSNVNIASISYDVRWGELSVLEAEMRCMKDLLKYKKWKYFINLTGQEFPLKTNWQLVKILKVMNGANDMEGTVKRRNIERTLFVHKGLRRTSKRKDPPPHNIRLTKGSVHITASRQFVEFLIHDRIAIDFWDWVKDTGIPDETFFSSLHHSPHLKIPGSYSGVPETHPVLRPFITRFKNWGSFPFDWPCAGKRVRMVCVFGIGDLPLLEKRMELFANKFYTDYQPLAYDCMEELHFNRTRDEYAGVSKFDTSYYEKLPIIYKKSHL